MSVFKRAILCALLVFILGGTSFNAEAAGQRIVV